MADIAESSPDPVSATGYKRMIAQAILFKGVHKAVRSGNYASFQANIVSYTVATLAQLTAGKLSLDAVCVRQGLSTPLLQYVALLASEVDKALRKSSGQRMVSEWAKKEECWVEVSSRKYTRPPTNIPELT